MRPRRERFIVEVMQGDDWVAEYYLNAPTAEAATTLARAVAARDFGGAASTYTATATLNPTRTLV